MIRRNWKLLGLCIALAMLAAALFAMPALADGEPVLTINGSTEAATAPANQKLDVLIESEGMTWARLYWVDEEGNPQGPDDWLSERERRNVYYDEDGLQRIAGGYLSRQSYELNWPGTFDVYAEVTYDDIREDTDYDSLNWVRSNTVVMTVTTEGDLPMPVLDKSSYTVRRGDILPIKLKNASALEGKTNPFAEAWIEPEGSDGPLAYSPWYEDGFDGVDTIYLDTTGLTPGETYEMFVQWCAEGYPPAGVDPCPTVTVLEPEEEVAFHIINTEPLVNERFMFSITAPGATQVQYCIEDVGEWDPVEGDCQCDQDWLGEGTFQVFARAYYEDGSTRESDRIEVRVSKVDDMPEFDFDMPNEVALGDDVVINLPTDLEYLDRFTVRLFSNNGEGIWEEWDCYDSELTFGPDRFDTVPESYRVNVEAIGVPGYESRFVEKLLNIVPASTTQWATVSVNGNSEGPVELMVGEDYSVDIDFSDDAPQFTAARLHWGGNRETWLLNDWGEWEDWQNDNHIHIDGINWGADGEALVYAQVYFGRVNEDTDWDSLKWVDTNAVKLQLGSNGEMEAPSFSFDESVEWGENLYIHIDDMGKYFEDPINTDYVHFCAQVMDPDDDYREVFHTNWVEACWDGGENLRIPSVYLEPGHTYAMAVEANVVGWFTARSEDVFFEVTGEKPADDEVSLHLSTNELRVHEQLVAQAYAAGADNVEIVVVNEDGDEVDRRGDGGELTCNTLGDWSDPYTFTVYAEAYYPDGTKKESERQTFSIVADGALDSPEITSMPTVSRVGEPVSFTYTATDADWMYIQLCRIQDGDWITLTDYNEDGTGSGSGTFDGEYFDRPATYVIGVYANAWDKYTGNMSRYFMVVEPSAENSVELTVNGSSDEVVTVQRHEGFSVDVYAPGATAIRILNGHNYDYWWDEPDPEHVHCDWSFPMYNIVFAQACYDEYDSSAEDFNVEDLNWTGFSNVIRVDTTTPNGDLAVPDVTVPESVARGDALVIPINSYQGVDEWYYAEVLAPHYDDEGNSWMEWSNHSDMANDEIRVPTMNLEPGDYTVRIACDAVGFNGNEVRVGFTVEESDYEPQVTAMVDRDSAVPHEDFHVYVYAPGADWVEARFRMESDPDWGDDRNGDGEMSDWWLSYDQPDRYLITPVGHYGDEEVFGEPVEFFINCDGWLEPVRANIPAIIHVGESLHVSFEPVEGAEWYHYDLSIDRGDDWEYFHDGEIRDGSTELDFDGYFFDEPGTYNLSLDAGAYGMVDSNADFRFTVVEEGLEQQVELTANGGTDDLEVLSHQPVTFEVNAPGAKAIRVFFGDHWDYWWDEENPEYVYEDWREFSDGVTAVVAQACYDDYNSGEEGFRVEDLNWTGYSNTIHLNVSSPYGSLDTPTISVPGNVKRGDWLTIHVDPVDNAERYEVYIDAFDENGEYVECRYGNNFYEAGDLQLSTESLTGEWSYQLHVSACSEGWNESWTDYYPFEVEQLSPEETRFDITPTELLTNQAFEVYIMAPGANAVRFCHNEPDNIWNEEWQDFMVVEHGIDRATTWTFYAYATYDEGETWVQIGDPIDVTANADVFLAEPEVTIDPAQPRAGEDVNITVQAVEFCDSIHLSIWNVQDYWNSFYDADQRVDGRDSVTFTVPADCFEANHGYVACVTASSDQEGYSAYVDKRVEFAVNGGEINGTISLDKTEALTSEDLTVTVDVPGATTIQLYLGEDEWRNVLGDHAEETFSRGRPDNYGIFARYSTDPIVTEEWWDSIDWDNFDWNQFNWDGLTNSVNLNVTANGEMEPPQFTIENEDNTVFRGKPLVIRITSDYGRDEWYGAEAFEGDNWYGYTHWNDSTRTIILPTNDLTPGEYELCVSTSAVGYTGSEAFATFTVTVPNVDYFQVYADADNSLIGYDIPFDLYAPGADKVRLNRNGEVWGEWDGEGTSEYWSEWGNETYTLTAEALYGSEWRSIGEAIDVTLGSLGDLAAPEQYFDSIVMLGEDFNFWFGETFCDWYKLMVWGEDGWLVNYDLDPGDHILTEDMYAGEERMQAGNIYTADISVWKPGYNPGWIPEDQEARVAMVDPNQVLYLPAALTEIDEEAFAGTNAQMIVVPSTVTSIGSRAFADCPNLVAVKLPEGASVAEDAFDGCHDELVIVYE